MTEVKLKQPFVISYSLGATINLGNYETMRVNVGLSVPIYDGNRVDEVFEKVIQKVEAILQKKVEEYSKTKQKDELPLILEEL